jgi:hypothetical protein
MALVVGLRRDMQATRVTLKEDPPPVALAGSRGAKR